MGFEGKEGKRNAVSFNILIKGLFEIGMMERRNFHMGTRC